MGKLINRSKRSPDYNPFVEPISPLFELHQRLASQLDILYRQTREPSYSKFVSLHIEEGPLNDLLILLSPFYLPDRFKRKGKTLVVTHRYQYLNECLMDISIRMNIMYQPPCVGLFEDDEDNRLNFVLISPHANFPRFVDPNDYDMVIIDNMIITNIEELKTFFNSCIVEEIKTVTIL